METGYKDLMGVKRKLSWSGHS